jgi:DNA polymerase I
MRSVPVEKLCDYACEDADLTLQLKAVLDVELEKYEMRPLFEEVEMPLVPVLVHMEQAGVKLDAEVVEGVCKNSQVQIIQIEKEIFELAGEEFNISSPKQMGPILLKSWPSIPMSAKPKQNSILHRRKCWPNWPTGTP